MGYPHPKTKKQGLGSFRLTGSIAVCPDAIQLPRLGRLRLKERGYLPTVGVKVLSATVAEQAGRWYVSLQVEQERAVPSTIGQVVGVDLGIKALATLSDGTVIANPKYLNRHLKKIKRLQRAVSRTVKGSANRKKAARRLGREHQKVRHQRANTVHQVTTMLAKTKSVIVIEDLHVAGMVKNHHLAQAISDVGFAEFRRRLTYKAAWYGSHVVVASRWEPSSKTCSACGWVNDNLTLANRIFRCEQCGQSSDRDLNAAINLSNLSTLAASSAESQNACGEVSAGHSREAVVKLPPVKQEPNTSYPHVE
ncbi:MAG: RNA-guided endonuclease InsQ/TnpB family protein [Candidatus Angelobacter sp.]